MYIRASYLDFFSCLMSLNGINVSHFQHGGGPTLSSDDYCIECLKEEALNFVSADGYRGRMAAMKQLAEAALAGKCTNGKLYYVSKTWYCLFFLFEFRSTFAFFLFCEHFWFLFGLDTTQSIPRSDHILLLFSV